MSAKIETYNKIREKIIEETYIKHCLLYNSQFDNMNQEDTFPFPCSFIEFSQLNYITKQEGLQEAEAIIRIHVGDESLQREDLSIIEYMEEIHSSLQGYSADNLFTPLNRVFEGQDTNHDNVRVWVMDYETLIYDLSGHRNNKRIKTSIKDVCINVYPGKPWLKRI